jgi:hypothetical protein
MNISPKGSGNDGRQWVQWYYWIPCSDGRWLQARSEQLQIVGRRKVELFTDGEMTNTLLTAGLNISMRSVEEVKDAVRISTTACHALVDIFK